MITIFQIPNTEGRNEQFLPLFSYLKNNNQGKYIENEYCIIRTDLNFNATDKAMQTFNALQIKLASMGIQYSMYILKK